MISRFDYESMVQKALRNVVHDSLKELAEKGFVGTHHFFITFQTNRSDVKISDMLNSKYPEEMTIVLQHQFTDLKVNSKEFSLTLSFDDQQENLIIPYNAVISFLDPSAKFGLQFSGEEENLDNIDFINEVNKTPDNKERKGEVNKNNVVALDSLRKKD